MMWVKEQVGAGIHSVHHLIEFRNRRGDIRVRNVYHHEMLLQIGPVDIFNDVQAVMWVKSVLRTFIDGRLGECNLPVKYEYNGERLYFRPKSDKGRVVLHIGHGFADIHDWEVELNQIEVRNLDMVLARVLVIYRVEPGFEHQQI